jgi:acyl-CoA reductase-like NAD-dependent aldehyde dehydrogenase
MSERGRVREYEQYIGGRWTGSGQLFDDLDPYRGTVMARIPAGTLADAAQADRCAADLGLQELAGSLVSLSRSLRQTRCHAGR